MKILVAALTCVLMGGVANASVTTNLSLGGGGGLLATNSIIVNGTLLTDNGVSFIPRFLVTSVGGNLFQDANGFGVDAVTDNFINPGETVTVSFLDVLGTGHLVNFDGFTRMELAGVDVPGEMAHRTIAAGTAFLGSNGPFGLGVDAGPISIAGVDSPIDVEDSSLSFFSVDAQFTASTVPEPGSLAALGVMGAGLVLRRRQRS